MSATIFIALFHALVFIFLFRPVFYWSLRFLLLLFSSSLLPVFLPCPHLLRLASNREMGERGGRRRRKEEGGKERWKVGWLARLRICDKWTLRFKWQRFLTHKKEDGEAQQEEEPTKRITKTKGLAPAICSVRCFWIVTSLRPIIR